MSRRPYIEGWIIKDEYSARGYDSRPDGYAAHCPYRSVVGQTRGDWFRWECRECDSTYISPRKEKRQAYYQCTECGAWHFVYKGFFDGDVSTVPLEQDECSVTLCRARLQYKDMEPVDYYGSPDWLKERIDRDRYSVVDPIRKV